MSSLSMISVLRNFFLKASNKWVSSTKTEIYVGEKVIWQEKGYSSESFYLVVIYLIYQIIPYMFVNVVFAGAL